MNFSYLAIIIALLSISSHGHYVFFRVAHNGEWMRPFQYIRNVTGYSTASTNWPTHDSGTVRYWSDPIYSGDAVSDITCGRGNLNYASATGVLKVEAGDSVSFAPMTTWPDKWEGFGADYWHSCLPATRNQTCITGAIYHDGPIQAYLSRVPGGTEINTYSGDGAWFKIYSLGLNTSRALDEPPEWLGVPSDFFTVTIPRSTPPGKYLLRGEHIAPSARRGDAQIFANCAQLEISGPGGGIPSPLVRFPEAYPLDHPGLLITEQMAAKISVDKEYTEPGGPVWRE